MSVPATNARSPVPFRIATRTSSRRSTSSQYSTSRSYMFHVSAFIASGRLNVIVATGPSTSNRISPLGSTLTLALLISALQRDPWIQLLCPSHNPLPPQPPYLTLVHANLRQNLIRLLPQIRRNPHLSRCLAELHRQPQQRHAAQHWVRPCHHHLPRSHLRMIERPVQCV